MKHERGALSMIIDVNVDLSRWPFRRLPCDELDTLLERLRYRGVTEAWAGTFDGLFHRDVAAANARLAGDCRRSRGVRLRPFGSVNPKLPDWREDLRRCAEEHHMPGIRLHPNYHGYSLDAPVFAELVDLAAGCGMIVQLAVRMDDVRVQHPLMQVADVDTGPLPKIVSARPGLRLVLLNALRTLRAGTISELAAAGQVYFEISMLEGTGGVAKVLEVLPPDRLLFGSHLPLFVLESAVFKMRESELPAGAREAILHKNARKLLETAGKKGSSG